MSNRTITKIDYSTQTIQALEPGEAFDILGSYLGEPGDTITVTTPQGDTFNADILDSWNQPVHGGSCSFTYVSFY